MRFAIAAVLAAFVLAPLGQSQKLDLKFDALAAKASEKAEVDLDASILKLALPHVLAAKGKDKDTKQLDDILSGLQELHVRHYAFAKADAYSDKDLEPLRKEVGEAAGWSRIVNVKDGKDNVEVFAQSQAGKISGCLIVAAAAKELSIVHIMGTMTTAQLKEMVDSKVAFNLAALMDMPGK